jgi:hypothetical protein
MPPRRLSLFDAEIVRARDLVGLGQGLGAMTHGRVDGSDLYRAALVQAVAALDSYVHGVVLDRAVDILLGRLSNAAGSSKVGLHFSAVGQIVGAVTEFERENLARAHVAQRLTLETFQRPDDISRAFSMVGVGKLWNTAFPADPQGAITALSLVVQRRNRIVHQCDADPLNPGAPTPLSDVDALDGIKAIEATVAAIDACC